MYSTIVSFFQEGGVFMYPIVLVFALGLAIAVERYLFLSITTTKNKAVWKKITPFLRAGNFAAAADVTGKSKAAVATIMTYGLNRVRSARRRDDVEKAMGRIKECFIIWMWWSTMTGNTGFGTTCLGGTEFMSAVTGVTLAGY